MVSGTDIARPRGQFRVGEQVIFEESRQVDFELEVAVVVGRGTKLGETVGVGESEEHVFGFVLLNDWSGEFSFLLCFLVFVVFCSILLDFAIRCFRAMEIRSSLDYNQKVLALEECPNFWIPFL